MSKLVLGKARINVWDLQGGTLSGHKDSMIVELDTCGVASAMKHSHDLQQISLLLWASSVN